MDKVTEEQLKDMKKPELLEMAKNMGLDVSEKMTVAVLKEMILPGEESKPATKKVGEKFDGKMLTIVGPSFAIYTGKSIEACSKKGFFLDRTGKDFGIRAGMVIAVSDGNKCENVVVK